MHPLRKIVRCYRLKKKTEQRNGRKAELFDYRFENIVACFKSSTIHDVKPWKVSKYPCPNAKGTAH